MAAHFTRTSYLIKERIIYTRVYQYLAIKWLHSRLRRFGLKVRNVYLVKLLNQRPVAEVYVALNDPYSYMLVQVLPEIEQRFNLNIKLYITHGALISFVENKQLWKKWALSDANDIAQLYGLKKLNRYPSQKALASGQQLWQLLPTSMASAQLIFDKTWTDDFEQYYQTSTPVITHQVKNLTRLVNKGHELSGSIYCLGEWFWGIDSLDHLEKSLNRFHFSQEEPQLKYGKSNLVLSPIETKPVTSESEPIVVTEAEHITAYLSIRSPYSYLGFMQAKQLSEHYQKPLKIKLVLPLLMRGVGVSTNKQRYLYLDACREAKQLNIPLKGFCEPLGPGILKSYQLFSYCESKGLALAYIQALFEAVFVHNIDLANERRLIDICQGIGVDYHKAKSYGETQNWQALSDLYQQELNEMGYWGVPCFSYQQQHCWGQDRLWKIQQALKVSN